MEDFIGIIKLFAGQRPPHGWEFCHGQHISISPTNMPLFSIIGTTYGGNGTTNFALPDLRGRVPVGAGQGQGLSQVSHGAQDGHETVHLTKANIPQHDHQISITQKSTSPYIEIPVNTTANSNDVDNAKEGIMANTGGLNYSSEPANGIYGGKPIPVQGLQLNGGSCAPAGGDAPISIIPPRLGIHFIICIEGIYPTTN